MRRSFFHKNINLTIFNLDSSHFSRTRRPKGVTHSPLDSESRPPLAVQQLYVHFSRQGGGVELLNHLHRGSGVTGEGQ